MYYILLKYPASAIINLYVCWALIAYHDYLKEDSPSYTFYNTMRDLIVLPDFTEFSRDDQLLVGKKLIDENAATFLYQVQGSEPQ